VAVPVHSQGEARSPPVQQWRYGLCVDAAGVRGRHEAGDRPTGLCVVVGVADQTGATPRLCADLLP